MQLGHLSPSKLERFRLCESRVEAQLFDEDYEEDKGEAAMKGTLTHQAAMLWYRPGSPYADWDSCFKAALESCAKKEVMFGGKKVTVSELPHEASSIQGARTFFEVIAARYPREALKIVFAERRYKGMLRNGVPIHLIIDLAIDRLDGTLEIIDWKTGFLACTTDDMYDKDQVLMNLLAVRSDPEFAHFKTIKFVYFWVAKDYQTGPIALSDERLSDYEYWLSLEYQRIMEIEKPTESINRFCSSCGRRTKCEKYTNFLNEAMTIGTAPTPEQLVRIDDESIMAQYDRLKGQMDLLEKYRDALGEHLKGALAIRQVTEIAGNNYKASLRSSKHNSYSPQTVLALCQSMNKDPAIVFSVKGQEVEALFADNPQAMTQLTQTMKRGQTKPSLSVTQTGVKKRSSPRKKKEQVPASTVEMPATPMPAQELKL